MKIVVYDVETWERESFKPLEADHDVVYREDSLSADTVGENADADIVSGFIYSDFSADTLSKMENLKLVVTRSTGVDHVATDWCDENGVKVAYVPGYGENTVAEHTFALLLAVSHRLIEAADRTRKGDFTNQGLTGFDLCGKTIGIIGTGNIGVHTCRIAKGFGMEVLAFDIQKNEDAARDIGFEYCAMEDLLQRSDVVSLHVPGTPKTKDLIGKEQFDRMKDGVVLINTARGTVVNAEALSEALLSGKVAGAGLDVLPEEPVIREEAETLRSVFTQEHDLSKLLAGHALLRLNNVVITPHNAFNTREAVQRILDTTRENIEGFIAGKPQNLANGKKG
ncbi:D-lactate dehydrogenase [Caenispirillum salinarum AK4]|uniref:D-lactate dehydrogenase n=1 Tax=Caenispirillum salinarum AK4 TaxID=1238182 RepID=K9HPT8_9PROT|nr:NAD(P)-dependent oxidoreductase [Caenispirillum salinarum]EKV32293.1 D-lactate dehydrogenase [Caenispirillum salinarum AK4]